MRWHLSRARPVRDEAGRVTRWFGTNTDVTERLAMEAALREADRRKDEFLATLAHELRNPLAPIRNALHLIALAGDDRAAVAETRGLMERQLAQMVRLIDDLLDLSRITRGTLELRKAPVELAAVVRAAVETSEPLVAAAGHELTVELPPGPWTIDADAVRLAQVFANLLNNAARYTPAGGRIRVTAARAAGRSPAGDVVVTVSDTGLGIPTAMLTRVFDMFTQVDRAPERTQGGLGIGLTLVKRLVELHGGTVEARSDGPDRGSVFVVRLPLAKADSGSRGAGSDGELSGTAPRPAPALKKVLVADDNRDAADSLGALLRVMGGEARVVYDGLAAVAAAAEFRPALALLDLGMPGLSGHDAARRIRQQPGGRDLLLVALTGWGQEEDHRRSREAGFDLHLVKPVDPAVLRSLLAGKDVTTG
jgi:signal transduction histidine kinase